MNSGMKFCSHFNSKGMPQLRRAHIGWSLRILTDPSKKQSFIFKTGKTFRHWSCRSKPSSQEGGKALRGNDPGLPCIARLTSKILHDWTSENLFYRFGYVTVFTPISHRTNRDVDKIFRAQLVHLPNEIICQADFTSGWNDPLLHLPLRMHTRISTRCMAHSSILTPPHNQRTKIKRSQDTCLLWLARDRLRACTLRYAVPQRTPPAHCAWSSEFWVRPAKFTFGVRQSSLGGHLSTPSNSAKKALKFGKETAVSCLIRNDILEQIPHNSSPQTRAWTGQICAPKSSRQEPEQERRQEQERINMLRIPAGRAQWERREDSVVRCRSSVYEVWSSRTPQPKTVEISNGSNERDRFNTVKSDQERNKRITKCFRWSEKKSNISRNYSSDQKKRRKHRCQKWQEKAKDICQNHTGDWKGRRNMQKPYRYRWVKMQATWTDGNGAMNCSAVTMQKCCNARCPYVSKKDHTVGTWNTTSPSKMPSYPCGLICTHGASLIFCHQNSNGISNKCLRWRRASILCRRGKVKQWHCILESVESCADEWGRAMALHLNIKSWARRSCWIVGAWKGEIQCVTACSWSRSSWERKGAKKGSAHPSIVM